MQAFRWWRVIGAVAASTLLVAGLSGIVDGPASTAPGDTPPPMSLRDIGLDSTLTLPGEQGQISLSIPVPADLTPDTLTGTTVLPAYVTSGFVDVLQGNRLLSRTPVNTAPNARIVLPLRGVTVDRNAADITVRSYLRTDATCQFDPDDAFRIVNTAITYSGTEAAPTTVADFLQPILRKLTIYIPSDVTQTEGEAAVTLATAVVAHYGTAPVDVETASLPRSSMTPTQRPGALERQIVISKDAPEGLTLQNGPGGPYLSIGGAESSLLAQVQFLTSSLEPIALASKAVPGQLYEAPQLPPDVQTLADLGVADQEVTSAAWPSLTIGIDQSRMGRPSKNIRVQLTGSYTPPPDNSGGRVSVWVGTRVIDSWETDASGTIDRWVSIPDDVVRRYTELRVRVERGDTRNGCGDGYRTTLSLSAAGEITSERADPPVPSGFQSLPQALMPRMDLAWTKGDVADVSRAVSIMTGLQHLSAVPLGVDVVSMSDAGSATAPAVLISADGADLPDIELPVTADSGQITVTDASGQKSDVTLTPAVGFGALQVARADDRTVLVATSTNDPADLDGALAWLHADPDRWAALNGDAMLKVANRDPVFVGSSETSSAQESGSSMSAAAIVAAILAVIGVLIAIAIVVFTLRRRGQ
ncbi:hypothetical protein ACWDTI_26395 [Gordonia sp. NPDC003424]